jgi:hypothetical protein
MEILTLECARDFTCRYAADAKQPSEKFLRDWGVSFPATSCNVSRKRAARCSTVWVALHAAAVMLGPGEPAADQEVQEVAQSRPSPIK